MAPALLRAPADTAASEAASATAPASGAPRARYRMKDLCELTGLPRQAIHFYIQQGLVPPGVKTGRNMAFYGPEHVERITLVRRLQHERFLPLRAIRALLDQKDESFSPEQQQLFAEVRTRLVPFFGGAAPGEPEPTVDALAELARAGLTREDLDDLGEAGLLASREDEPGRPVVAQSDAWMIEAFGQLRAAGFSAELGFSGRDLAIVHTAVTALLEAETRLLSERMSHLSPERIADMLVRALPLINDLVTRYHVSLARNYLSLMPADAGEEKA